MNILAGYPSSVFQDFESYLRTEIDLVEDEIRLVLDKYNSSFITYELQPGVYIFKDISKALFNILQPKNELYNNSIDIEYDYSTMQTKLVVRPGYIAIRFDEKSCFCNVLGFTSGWDYKHYNEYTSQKSRHLSSKNKAHLKCDVIDGSVVIGLRKPILYSLVFDRKTGFKYFSPLKLFITKKSTEMF